MHKIINLKLGGSLLSRADDNLYDFGYVRKLQSFLTEFVQAGGRATINVGGGFVTRKYQNMLKEHGEQDEMDLHRLGVAATNMNAEILRGLMDDISYPEVLSYSKYEDFLHAENVESYFAKASVLVFSASQPGTSNDNNALDVALKSGSTQVLSLKNVDGVYTADPKKDSTATRVAKLTWTEYMNIIGNPDHHTPGASFPVDVLTARRAAEVGASFVILHGENFENIKRYLSDGEFVGTVIQG